MKEHEKDEVRMLLYFIVGQVAKNPIAASVANGLALLCMFMFVVGHIINTIEERKEKK